ncbi:MAG: hypothetical protein HN356_09605 [Calditrichaeota bacterium]|jgi:hypothetical protein|nr:hypothetical protein [Calditrichota bacterium]MBT7787434.1 hypothetical protein [Calditrichota bacterium]
MINFRKKFVFVVLLFAVVASTFVTGCDEQPVGYLFEPSNRDHSSVAQASVVALNKIFEHTDQAAAFLDQSALTSDYKDMLIGNWQEFEVPDSLTNELYTLYYLSVLDKEHYFLRFDREVMPDALRSPSSLDFRYVEVRSFQDRRTNEFFGQTSESRSMSLEYANNRQDIKNVDGWFDLQTLVPIEIDVDIAGAGSVTIEEWVGINWQIRIEDYSVDTDDHSAKIIIAGLFPLFDRNSNFIIAQITGEINVRSDGRGSGTMFLRGEPVAKLHLTGRNFGFLGFYSLSGDDFEDRFRLN